MKEIWERIENWLKENYPNGLEKLNEGASEELIGKNEQLMGIKFPEDVREFYSIHDGAKWGFPLVCGFDLLSMNEIYNQWKIWTDLLKSNTFNDFQYTPHEAIRRDWYNAKWIPLTFNGSGDHHCLDLAPTEKGTIGQIIEMWHEDDVRPLVADSFREWITEYVEALEEGEYVYSDDYEGIVSIDDI